MMAWIRAMICEVRGHHWTAPDHTINFRSCTRCGANGWMMP